MSSEGRTHGPISDEAVEIARLIEELQTAKTSAPARPPQQPAPEPVSRSRVAPPPNPWQPVVSTSALIDSRPSRFSKAFGRLANLQLGRRMPGPMGPRAVWGCVALGLLLSVSMMFWPYSRGCGAGLFCYLGAVGMVHVAGIWGAWHAWDSRVGIAHVLALIVVLWGGSLAAKEILPRVGYAKASASWDCSAPTTRG